MTIDDAIEKIRKLLALSESPNENEAAVAASKAAQLMEQFGIEAERVRRDSGEKRETDRHYERFAQSGRAAQDWNTDLGNEVARLFGCRMLFGDEGMTFYGLRADAKAAGAIYRYLADNVLRLAVEESDRRQREGLYRGYGFVRAFCEGAGERLGQRLAREFWKRKRESEADVEATGFAMVRADAAEEAIKQFEIKVNEVTPPERSGSNTRGYFAGVDAGERMDLGLSKALERTVTP